MSKRKRDVAFLKPEEPAFITRMKALAGYTEGPTVDTKREASSYEDGDSDDHDDELPQVVVVKEGDLSAEEASKIKQLQEEAPADLNQRVVFRKPEKSKKSSTEAPTAAQAELPDVKKTKGAVKTSSGTSKSKTQNSKTKSILSFDEDDESEEL